MKRSFLASGLVSGLLFVASAALSAQDAGQSTAYQGVSHPPADDEIVTTSIAAPKPPAGQPADAQPAPRQDSTDPVATGAPPAAALESSRPTSVDPAVNFPAPDATVGTDAGVVGIAPSSRQPALNTRSYAGDPDGDIVHPRPLRPGELEKGTTIRVHLLDRLSTSDSERGEPFRTQVATDVLQGGQVVIPAGSEIDGRVVEVSTGHAGGHGTMRLAPDSVILPNGSRFTLHAEVTSTPGSHARVAGEGTIRPDSRAKRDGIEYGGAVGSGLVVGGIVAGPAGALTGGLIGAGAITVHLLVSHPQATLEPGATLVFQLTDRLYLAPDSISGN